MAVTHVRSFRIPWARPWRWYQDKKRRGLSCMVPLLAGQLTEVLEHSSHLGHEFRSSVSEASLVGSGCPYGRARWSGLRPEGGLAPTLRPPWLIFCVGWAPAHRGGQRPTHEGQETPLRWLCRLRAQAEITPAPRARRRASRKARERGILVVCRRERNTARGDACAPECGSYFCAALRKSRLQLDFLGPALPL